MNDVETERGICSISYLRKLEKILHYEKISFYIIGFRSANGGKGR